MAIWSDETAMTTTWELEETLESPFAPIDSIRLPFEHDAPSPVPPGRLRFRTRHVAADNVPLGGALPTAYAIARDRYGSDAWEYLIEAANPGVNFKKAVPAGTILRVPAAVVPEEALIPSDLVGGSPVTMSDPLAVPFGQFTFDAEGNDKPDNKYYSRKPHRPDSTSSGVTVGRGYDLGQHKPEEIVTALTQAGVSSEYAAKVSAAAKLKGCAAETFKTTFSAENPTFELTREQQWTLFVWEYMRQANIVARKLTRWEIARRPATPTDITSLDATTIELLIDLNFRGDLGDQKVWELLRPAVNNRPALAALMQKKSNWPNVPVERYQARCDYLGVPADKEVGWELESEQPPPGAQISAAVGQGQTNSPDDVRRVQARLRQLGMSWVPDSGTIGAATNDPTDHGIRLFRAMLEGEQLWVKKEKSSPCYGTPAGRNRGVIRPGSTEETWLWSADAPRWLSAVPAQRDGWCCNDRRTETGCRTDIAEPAMSSWLAEYLDQVGRAFRGKVQALRPVLTVLASQGVPALERLRSPSMPRTGPLSPAEEEAKLTAAIAQRVAVDLVNPASAARPGPTRLAGDTVAAIDGGRIVLTVTHAAVPQGGCSANHLGHQQGLEFDLRLFAHDGPKADLTWKDTRCSRLLMGLAVDCFVENTLTRQVIYNDPAIRERVGARLSSDRAGGTTHDNHVHVGILGSAGHQLIPASPPADTGGRGPTLEQFRALSDEDFAGERPRGCCSRCAQGLEAADAFEQFGSPDGRTYAIADYVSLVRKVEAAYPRWTPDEVLSALRRVAGYDLILFRILYGTSEAKQIKPGDGGLTTDDLRDLEAMSSHRGGPPERGVAIDPLGQKVAVGHVLCGLSAGEHRNVAVGMLGGWLVGAALQHVAGLTLDNLYATTIAGDLGQSAVLVHLGKRSLLGPESEATDAELIGDIDGCVLASNGALGGRRVSDVLARYYWPAPPASGDVHAANRFRLFAPHLTGSVLQDQTTRFARAFFVREDPRRGSTESAAGEVAQILIQFRAWYGQKLAAETARQAGAQPEHEAWSLDETFESPYAPAVPVRLPLAHEGPVPGGGELWVPGAERVANPRSAGGTYLDAPWRFVFHTIEGEPSAAAFRRLAAEHTNTPHLWAMPSADLLLQTVPLNRSAYALARPGSVQTNRLRAVQVEMWGFAAKMGSMDQRTIEWLADRLLGPVAKLVPINLDHVRPTGGVSCYGENSACRMTPEQWQVFDGVCGHQHVPDNKHWDPGDAPLRAIAIRARGSAGSVPQREQLADHDGPGFAAERDEDEFESPMSPMSWTGYSLPAR
jgi:hypothetical protein